MTDVRPEASAALAAERLLVGRLLGGATDARGALVGLCHAAVRQTISLAAARWGSTIGPADVDDAVQQAFLAFFAHDDLILRRWRGDARLKTYLNRVAERVALRHFHALVGHRGRFVLAFSGGGDAGDASVEGQLEALVTDAQHHGLLEVAPDLERALENVETQAEVRRAILDRLSEKGREYYGYLFVEELEIAEICRREETNPNNVYQWKNRILREAAAVLMARRNSFRVGRPQVDPSG